MKTSAAALLLGLSSLCAHAQIVYRCANAYAQEQQPCPQARAVDVSDARTDAQRADGARVAAADRRLADEMGRERLARESTAKAATAKGTSTKAKRPRVSKIKWFRP